MNRRDFLRAIGILGASTLFPTLARPAQAATPSGYTGPIFFNIHANGGLDQSFFADPREDPVINTWAQSATAGQAGNIRYAPLPGNRAFFEKYYQDMLVVNGVDSETNAHLSAVRSSWSGRLAGGYPNVGELIAGVLGPELPMSYVFGGGYGDNVGVMPYTRLVDPALIREIANPNRVHDNRDWIKQGDLDKVQRYRQERVAALLTKHHLPGMARALHEFNTAHQGRDLIERLADQIPADGVDRRDSSGALNPLVRDAHLALICASAGLTSNVNLSLYGFDTHSNHDTAHSARLQLLTGAIDYLWEKAETLGLAHRMTVFLTSDFSRTPHYNPGSGKDHWPIGSALFMKKNTTWGNRVVGATDAGHRALRINPQTLALDDSERGVALKPRHVLQAYRNLAGISDHPILQNYPLDAEDIDMFNSNRQTGYAVAFA